MKPVIKCISFKAVNYVTKTAKKKKNQYMFRKKYQYNFNTHVPYKISISVRSLRYCHPKQTFWSIKKISIIILSRSPYKSHIPLIRISNEAQIISSFFFYIQCTSYLRHISDYLKVVFNIQRLS